MSLHVLVNSLHKFEVGTCMHQWVLGFNPSSPVCVGIPIWVTLKRIPLESIHNAMQLAGSLDQTYALIQTKISQESKEFILVLIYLKGMVFPSRQNVQGTICNAMRDPPPESQCIIIICMLDVDYATHCHIELENVAIISGSSKRHASNTNGQSQRKKIHERMMRVVLQEWRAHYIRGR